MKLATIAPQRNKYIVDMNTSKSFPRPTLISILLAAALMVGCGSVPLQPVTPESIRPVNAEDAAAIRRDVDPIVGPLTLEEALARTLKYNLEHRTKMMEQALALNLFDVTGFDMLPKLVAQTRWGERNNDRINQSRNAEDGTLSTSRFISQEKSHRVDELSLTWSLLDLGTGYYSSRQQGDRVLIAAEKRRKAIHTLMQDVKIAFWRAASAQKLRDEVAKTIRMAEEALADSRKAEFERLRSPLDSLRYQRQLLENLRLLEAINQELSTAEVELASLINAPLGQPIKIAEGAIQQLPSDVLTIPVSQLEEVALEQNADLREQHYNASIAREETRKTLLRLFPNLSLNYSVSYDTDKYLVNRSWNEAGLQLSFNLFNLFTGPSQLRLAEAGVALADQRRMATQLSVLTQVHLARLQLVNARGQFERADAIYAADQKIADHVRNRETAQAQSKLDRVSNETSAILSLLRRYQALAQVQSAESKLMANIGLEPKVGSVSDLSLQELTQQLRESLNLWQTLNNSARAKLSRTKDEMPAPQLRMSMLAMDAATGASGAEAGSR